MENNEAIKRGLQAAKQAAQEEGMTGKVEELSNQLQQGVTTQDTDDDGDGLPLAAKDGFRYDYDDSSDVK